MIKYVFRADGNTDIGIGHLMRTLTVADAIAMLDNQANILVICADSDSTKIAEIRGYKAVCLNSDYRNLMSEVSLWKKLGLYNCCILVDSYLVTNDYLRAIGKYGKVFLFDDTMDEQFDVHGIINYSVFVDERAYAEKYGNIDKFLLGGSFVPVRNEFTKSQWQLREKVKDILISTGGSDSFNIAGEIYKALDSVLPDINFHIVVGPFSPFLELLNKMAEESDNLIIHCNVQDMAGLMEKCDVAISAGGSTMYELATVGIPTICFSYARNQEPFCERFGETVSDYAGAYDKEPDTVLNNLKRLLCDKYHEKKYRQECSNLEKDLIDGNGAKRIAQALINAYEE